MDLRDRGSAVPSAGRALRRPPLLRSPSTPPREAAYGCGSDSSSPLGFPERADGEAVLLRRPALARGCLLGTGRRGLFLHVEDRRLGEEIGLEVSGEIPV